MLQYVSDILKNFTPGQRVFVLVLILFSIIAVTVGPGLSDSFFPGKEDLIKSISEQKERIGELEKEIIDLKGQKSKNADECEGRVRSESIACTDAIIRRERQILEMLAILKNNMEAEDRILLSYTQDQMVIIDTTEGEVQKHQSIPMPTKDNSQSIDQISMIMGEIGGHIHIMESQKTPE